MTPRTVSLLACAGATWLSGCSADTPLGDLAIEDVTVVDAVGGAREGQTVVIRGDTIVSVGDADDELDADEVVGGTGMYLIPGLWDMHVHLTYDSLLTEAMPELFLRWGVTSVRDTGGLLARILPVVERWRAEGTLAPRLRFAGPLLDGEKVVYDGDGRPEIGTGNATVEEARAKVATLAAAGVDFIKIYEMISPEVFDALVLAGEEHGLPIAAHVPLSMRAREVAPRVGSMEHLRNIEMDCASRPEELRLTRRRELTRSPAEAGAALRSRLHALQRLPAIAAYDPAECAQVLATMTSTIQVPTLRLNSFALHPAFIDDEWFEALVGADAIAESWDSAGRSWRAAPQAQDTTFAAWSLRLVGDMLALGIPIGAGTDTPINYSIPGYALHTELEMLVRAGLDPLEAIRAATVRPAEFFGIEDEMGQVAPGMRADLVLLRADPLADIRNTRDIEAVVSRGRLLTRAALEQLVR